MVKSNTLRFAVNDNIVYPKHGVGVIIDIEEQEISGMKLELYVIRFEAKR